MERHFWLGSGLLALLLALGIWISCSTGRIHEPICHTLEQAADAALKGDLDTGIRLMEQAQAEWTHHWHLTAAVADHEPMEEIDSLFSQTEIYARAADIPQFAAYCARLGSLLEAMADAHELRWWNLM